ncbi:MAG: PilT/PilU family type 4a pilus ATPase [Cyanobacteria bacterium SIG31]|nr:PilT/PilU family type 4a pilus ATPase [Cyanobacteria bacterium SIG31]
MNDNFNIIQFLKSAVATGASDEHLKVGHSPFIRKNGFIKRTNMVALTKDDIEKAIAEIAPQSIAQEIQSIMDIDFMFEIKGCSRFRINFNRQMGLPAMVIRNIPYTIPKLSDLELPEVLNNLINYQNGIIFVTGPTGSGKSTTLASLINGISLNSSKHIITIEDPIEYVFNCRKSIISQRQIGVDTSSFSDGIKYALRQDPDVIFIGEIRDKDTMEAALKAAETGHLVLTTLHTNDAVQTINRIVNMFEESNRYLVRKQLAETLRATIAQKLIYSEEKQKRYPACEILVTTPTIKDYISKDNTEAIYELIKENNIDNMISMNLSLLELVQSKLISEKEALENSSDPNELEKMFRGIYQGTKAYYE